MAVVVLNVMQVAGVVTVKWVREVSVLFSFLGYSCAILPVLWFSNLRDKQR